MDIVRRKLMLVTIGTYRVNVLLITVALKNLKSCGNIDHSLIFILTVTTIFHLLII